MPRPSTEPSAVALLDPTRRRALNALAEMRAKAPIELLNDAVDALIEADRWQRAEIESALREAEAGDFASAEDVAAAFAPR